MGRSVFILGAGGMARETFDIYVDTGKEIDVLGFLEENCKNEGTNILRSYKRSNTASYAKR